MQPASPSSATVSVRLPFARVFIAIAGIYITQSLVSGVTFQALPAVLRANGAPLDQIGMVSLALLPWALKFLWAPWIERYRHGGSHGRSRRIVVTGEMLVAATLLAAAYVGPGRIMLLLALLGLAALLCASVDIACDGFAVEQLSPDRRGWGNVAQVGGSYLGFMLGGGVYLWAVPWIGFQGATLGLAVVLLLLTVPFAVLAGEPALAQHVLQHRPSLRFALRRRAVRLGLLLVAACWLGPRVSAGLTSPFLIDRGIGLDLLGMLNGGVFIVAGLAGTAAGGLIVHVFGPRNAVAICVGLMCGALLALGATATLREAPLAVLVASQIALTASMAGRARGFMRTNHCSERRGSTTSWQR